MSRRSKERAGTGPHSGSGEYRREAPLQRFAHYLTLHNKKSSPPWGSTAYELLHRSINRQVTYMVTKNDINFALSPTFRYGSIGSPL
ncbi:hypothetical protein TNCV_781881 [Trichonephila clavipes]|nr:hypothetical protein TNCV_781881 [Trichonephila clavipes]